MRLGVDEHQDARTIEKGESKDLVQYLTAFSPYFEKILFAKDPRLRREIASKIVAALLVDFQKIRSEKEELAK